IDAAAVGGNVEVVSGLLEAGAQPDVQVVSCRSKRSALYKAILLGHKDVARPLAEHGVDVNACSDDGFTALHAAALHDHAGAVDTLIKAGADVEFKADCGSTPLACAAINSSCKAMHALLQRGAKVDVRDNEGCTPLHEACRAYSRGLEAVVDALLRWGADETSLNNFGRSP
ncbi:unnamed protein product, partial [Ectocarpus fasciculatus]